MKSLKVLCIRLGYSAILAFAYSSFAKSLRTMIQEEVQKTVTKIMQEEQKKIQNELDKIGMEG